MQAVCDSPLVGPETLVVVEYPKALHPRRPKGFFTYVLYDKLYGIRNRTYGRTNIAIYAYTPRNNKHSHFKEFAPTPRLVPKEAPPMPALALPPPDQ
mmetsp:Transcript_67054/g.119084  ORF Transcript_67054/g.119084 Transcript_67054/m.119084 type:complete len:97 (-) Transcript_67054:23-313(-)